MEQLTGKNCWNLTRRHKARTRSTDSTQQIASGVYPTLEPPTKPMIEKVVGREPFRQLRVAKELSEFMDIDSRGTSWPKGRAIDPEPANTQTLHKDSDKFIGSREPENLLVWKFSAGPRRINLRKHMQISAFRDSAGLCPLDQRKGLFDRPGDDGFIAGLDYRAI